MGNELSPAPTPSDNRVQRFLISGREALTPEGLAKMYAALQGRPVTPEDVAIFRELEPKRSAAQRADGDPA